MAEKFKSQNISSVVLVRPHITEKASMLGSDANAYVFRVPSSANKIEVKQAVHEMYKVKPIRVNMVHMPAKEVFTRGGRRGTKSGFKKAIVYLKKGDRIEVM